MYLYIYITTYIHTYTHARIHDYGEKEKNEFYDYNYTRIKQYLLLCTVLSLIILLIVHYYTYTYVNIYTETHTHTQSSHICNIEYVESTLRTISGMQMPRVRGRAHLQQLYARTLYAGVLNSSLSEFFRSYSPSIVLCVLARLCVCAPMRTGFITIVLARGTTKSDETRTACADSRQRDVVDLVGLECVFFARARSRGLSRSQPVFVIIMLEKCMNICFNNASSYFISFYD